MHIVITMWFLHCMSGNCMVKPGHGKQDGGIRLERQFKSSVGSGIDADCTEKRKL